MSSYNPWEDLRNRERLTLILADLPHGASALYFPDIHGIALSRTLTQVERRCALAHELAHIDLGHHQVAGNGAGCGRLARRQEQDADDLAARRLISIDDLADAARHNGNEPHPTAQDLHVTELMLSARLAALTTAERHQVRSELERMETVA